MGFEVMDYVHLVESLTPFFVLRDLQEKIDNLKLSKTQLSNELSQHVAIFN